MTDIFTVILYGVYPAQNEYHLLFTAVTLLIIVPLFNNVKSMSELISAWYDCELPFPPLTSLTVVIQICLYDYTSVTFLHTFIRMSVWSNLHCVSLY